MDGGFAGHECHDRGHCDQWHGCLIVDAKSDKVFRYSGAASRLTGSQNAASSFNLASGNASPKDVVTDGAHLWIVNDASQDNVFKYTLGGSLVGSWTISGGGGAPTGITLDPANVSHLWIVDNNTDRVYQFDNAAGRISGSQVASTSFALVAGNTNPQGIADPPAASSEIDSAVATDVADARGRSSRYDRSPTTEALKLPRLTFAHFNRCSRSSRKMPKNFPMEH